MASNGTLLSITRDGQRMTSMVGLNEDLVPLWSVQNCSYDLPVQGPGSIIYYLEPGIGPSVDGQESKITTLCAYNTSNASFLYRTEIPNSLTWSILVDGDHVFLVSYESVWAVGPDGKAYRAEGCDGWKNNGIYNGGLLLSNDRSMKLVGNDGSTDWQYDMDSGSILEIFPGENGALIVVTNSAVTAIHKPTISTSMTYLVGLIVIDLLVVVIGSLWILHYQRKCRSTP
jgi:hypothetical protein